jgi:hypothetical protein
LEDWQLGDSRVITAISWMIEKNQRVRNSRVILTDFRR